MKQLTPKQAKFVNEYLIDHNATAAARRAGYSARTANVQGAQLLSNAKVKNEVASRQAKDSKNLQITKNMLLLELARIAFADPSDLIFRMQKGQSIEGMGLKFLKSMTKSKRGWSMTTVDKISAIGLLMKYMGFESKPVVNDSHFDKNTDGHETHLRKILRIVAERAKRESVATVKNISEAAAHPSSPSHPEKGPLPGDSENKKGPCRSC